MIGSGPGCGGGNCTPVISFRLLTGDVATTLNNTPSIFPADGVIYYGFDNPGRSHFLGPDRLSLSGSNRLPLGTITGPGLGFVTENFDNYLQNNWAGGGTGIMGSLTGAGQYGWARFYVEPYSGGGLSVTLLDFAYEETPGLAITSSSIPGPSAVPEPSTWAMSGTGAVAVLVARRRRSNS